MESTHNNLIEETTQLNHNVAAITAVSSMLQKSYSSVVNQINELLMQNQSMQTQLAEKENEISELKAKLEGAENALTNMAPKTTSEVELVE